MTKRKADMLRVAGALGIEPVPGQTAGELAERCAERAAELVDLLAQYESEAVPPKASEPGPTKAARSGKSRKSKRPAAAAEVGR